jgi:hypothetical protein
MFNSLVNSLDLTFKHQRFGFSSMSFDCSKCKDAKDAKDAKHNKECVVMALENLKQKDADAVSIYSELLMLAEGPVCDRLLPLTPSVTTRENLTNLLTLVSTIETLNNVTQRIKFYLNTK